MSKTDLKKTTDLLKKNGNRFEVVGGAVHVEGRLIIQQGKRVSLPALVKSGSVDVRENATLTAPALATITTIPIHARQSGISRNCRVLRRLILLTFQIARNKVSDDGSSTFPFRNCRFRQLVPHVF